MSDVRIIEIKQSVFADNDRQADQLRAELKEKGFLVVSGRINRRYFLEKACYGTDKYDERNE